MAFDITKVQKENEDARRLDAAHTRENFDRLLHNDKEILVVGQLPNSLAGPTLTEAVQKALEVQQQQMQEAVVCLQRVSLELRSCVTCHANAFFVVVAH